MPALLRRALRSSWTWLLAGALLLPFAASQTVIPAAAWLAPVCLLRFTRTASRGRIAWGAVLLAYAFGIAAGLRNGLAPLPLVGIGLVALASGLVRSLSYVADRVLAPSLQGIRRSLVFPAAMAVVEWVVSWPESTPVLEEDLDALLEKGGALARRERLHLVMTPWVIRRTDRFPFVENLSVLVDPEGRVRWRYPKTYPVLGIEDVKFGRGPGIVPQAETPSGRLASVICQDLDFPRLVRKAGQSRTDLLIGPADDWPAIRTTHAQMAVFRAIENGTSLLRSTNNGISLAVDPQGRILGATGSQAQAAPLLLSALPLSGTATLYSLAGDWFASVCLAGLGALWAVRRLRLAGRERRQNVSPKSSSTR